MGTWSQHQGRINYTVTVQTALPSLAVKTPDASLRNLHCSPEKTTSTPTLNLCSLHPILLIALVMDRENTSTCWEAAPLTCILPSGDDSSPGTSPSPSSLEARALASLGHRTGGGSAGRAQRSSRGLSNTR